MFVKGKVALITGGASGIGLSIAKEFLKNGIKGVLLADVNSEKGKDVTTLLEEEYGPNKVVFLKVDVADRSEFENAFKKTIEKFQNLDIVVNNAGIGNDRDKQKLININLTGVLYGTLLAIDEYLPKYKTVEDAIVINIASILGLDGCPFAIAYTASKHGIIGIGKSLSTKAHFEATGVKILTICPGFTATEMISNSESVLPGRYNDIMEETLPTIYLQKREVVSSAVMKILEDFNTGDVWIIEDDECYQVEVPSRKSLRKIRTLEI